MKLKNHEELVKAFETNVSLEKFAEAEINLTEITKQKSEPSLRERMMEALERFLEYKAVAKPLSFYAKGKMFFVALNEGADLLIPDIFLRKVEKANKNAVEQGFASRFSKTEINYLKDAIFVPSGLPEEVAVSFGFKDAETSIINAKRNPTALVETTRFFIGFEGYLREHPVEWKKIEQRIGKTYNEILRTFAESTLSSSGIATLKSQGYIIGVEIDSDPSKTYLRIGDLSVEFNAKETDKIYKIVKTEKLPILEEKNNKLVETGERITNDKTQKLEADEYNSEVIEKNKK